MFTDAAGHPLQVGDFIAYGSGRGCIGIGKIVDFDPIEFIDPQDAHIDPTPPPGGWHRAGRPQPGKARYKSKRGKGTSYGYGPGNNYPTKQGPHIGPNKYDFAREWNHGHAYRVKVLRNGSGTASWLSFPTRLVRIDPPVNVNTDDV